MNAPLPQILNLKHIKFFLQNSKSGHVNAKRWSTKDLYANGGIKPCHLRPIVATIGGFPQ